MPDEAAKTVAAGPSLDFGQFIAYILPGFVVFYSVTAISAEAKTILDAALAKDTSAGAALIILLSSLSLGVIVSGVRGIALDPIQKRLAMKRSELNYEKLRDPNTLAAFREAIDNRYRYAQSYGNMALALGLWLILHFWIQHVGILDQLPFFIILTSATILLLLCHRSMLVDTYKALSKILS